MSPSMQLLAVSLAAAVLAACDTPGVDVRHPEIPAALRVRTDAQRSRVWMLGRETLSVHDRVSGRELGRVALPGWLFVDPDLACAPDLVLDAGGSAYVSSNIVPVLWQVDGQTLEVTRAELALDADRERDVGFSSLSVAADGSVLAASAVAGSLWGIDVRAGTAEKLLSFRPFEGACELDALLRATGYPRQWLARSRPGYS